MNCQSCNTRIEYLYLTNCEKCGCVLDAIAASQLPPLPEVPPLESFRKRLGWKRRTVNISYVFANSIAWMFSGAVVVWVSVGYVMNILIDFLDPVQTPGEYCGLGQMVGFFSILGGGILGSLAGCLIAVKRPLFRTEIH